MHLSVFKQLKIASFGKKKKNVNVPNIFMKMFLINLADSGEHKQTGREQVAASTGSRFRAEANGRRKGENVDPRLDHPHSTGEQLHQDCRLRRGGGPTLHDFGLQPFIQRRRQTKDPEWNFPNPPVTINAQVQAMMIISAP